MIQNDANLCWPQAVVFFTCAGWPSCPGERSRAKPPVWPAVRTCARVNWAWACPVTSFRPALWKKGACCEYSGRIARCWRHGLGSGALPTHVATGSRKHTIAGSRHTGALGCSGGLALRLLTLPNCRGQSLRACEANTACPIPRPHVQSTHRTYPAGSGRPSTPHLPTSQVHRSCFLEHHSRIASPVRKQPD